MESVGSLQASLGNCDSPTFTERNEVVFSAEGVAESSYGLRYRWVVFGGHRSPISVLLFNF